MKAQVTGEVWTLMLVHAYRLKFAAWGLWFPAQLSETDLSDLLIAA